MKRVHLLPNAITLANAFCGVLALSKAVDALALSVDDPVVFYRKMETACLLVFLGMLFDSLDGLVARLTRGHSDFGAQLDSFADALTFGVVPAILAKVLIEHEGPLAGHSGSARLHFLASAAFALMAILRLVRFTLETDQKESHHYFRGLPSPAAAGAVASTIWMYLILRRPELEATEGTPTPMNRILAWLHTFDWTPVLDWIPVALAAALPIFGLLMVSRVRYAHFIAHVSGGPKQFVSLVAFVFGLLLLMLAPVPVLFLVFNGFAVSGLVTAFMSRRSEETEETEEVA